MCVSTSLSGSEGHKVECVQRGAVKKLLPGLLHGAAEGKVL